MRMPPCAIILYRPYQTRKLIMQITRPGEKIYLHTDENIKNYVIEKYYVGIGTIVPNWSIYICVSNAQQILLYTYYNTVVIYLLYIYCIWLQRLKYIKHAIGIRRFYDFKNIKTKIRKSRSPAVYAKSEKIFIHSARSAF